MRFTLAIITLLAVGQADVVASVPAPSYVLTTLGSLDGINGRYPYATLLSDSVGNLYGTATEGGAFNFGTIFKWSAETGKITTIAAFNKSNGARPHGSLIADADGNLYGTTNFGGAFDLGTVFRVNSGTNTLTTLMSFDKANGAFPLAGLVADSEGNLYGTTSRGGSYNYGTIFRLAEGSNELTTLVSFNGFTGLSPEATLIIDAANNLYGTTFYGGENAYGSIFRLATDTNVMTQLFSFDTPAGANPRGGLVADSQGNLYGTTYSYGPEGHGTVFKLSALMKALIPLVAFDGANGAFPTSGLLADADGNLYGTTVLGGDKYRGTVFRIAAGSHEFTTLLSFDGTDGNNPFGGLISDLQGNLYGTTGYGGDFTFGAIFKLTKVPESSALTLAAMALTACAARRAIPGLH